MTAVETPAHPPVGVAGPAAVGMAGPAAVETAAPTTPEATAPHTPTTADLYRRHLGTGRAVMGTVLGGMAEVHSEGAWVYTDDGRRYLDFGGTASSSWGIGIRPYSTRCSGSWTRIRWRPGCFWSRLRRGLPPRWPRVPQPVSITFISSTPVPRRPKRG